MHEKLHLLFRGIMEAYRSWVPDLDLLVKSMQKENLIKTIQDIENDHFAFRTFGVPNLGIESLAPLFCHHGYQRRDPYHFESKKLDAYWYAPPSDFFPRVFISELRVQDLSKEAQKIIYKYTSSVKKNPLLNLNLDDVEAALKHISKSHWDMPTIAEYESLAKESEYAAWVICNQNRLNHFTITIQNLPAGYNKLEEFNRFLEKHGFKLNDSGGKIKISGDQKLLQSSTTAQLTEWKLADGPHSIPGSYIEFAERRVLDTYASLPANKLERKHFRDGFEQANADKIFESTYSKQTKR